MTHMEWPRNEVIRLIKEYKDKPELWDPKHSYFRVSTTKFASYRTLAESFDRHVTEVKRKVNSVLSSYRGEKKKVALGGRSTWFLYPYMSFLPNYVENNNQEITLKSSPKGWRKKPETQASDEEQVETPEGSDVSCEENGEEIEKETKHVRQRPKLKPRLIRKGVKGRLEPNNPPNLHSALLDMIKLLKSDSQKKKDDCGSFGEYIALSLRRHDVKTQAMIKQAINNILFEQDMKKYNLTQYNVVQTVEDNPLMIHRVGGMD